jgi:hypothetical protein
MANKKTYTVETRFEFTGTFEVKAKSKQGAIEFVEKHCGLVIGGDIYSTLPDEDINWQFPVHPEKKIVSIM